MDILENEIPNDYLKGNHISIYKNHYDIKGTVITVYEALERIKKGANEEIIIKIRSTDDKKYRSSLKSTLMCVTWGGVFSIRKKECLKEPSGLACLDFDDIENINELKRALKKSKYILGCWVSPSGNGIKALVKIPLITTDRQYKDVYEALLDHFKSLNTDEKTKDINRLCYESYDPDLYLNVSSEVFTQRIIQPIRPVNQQRISDTYTPESEKVKRLFLWWKKKYPFHSGVRNNNLFYLACLLCEFGVSHHTSLDFLKEFEEDDFGRSEIRKLVDSAYKNSLFNSKSFNS